MHAAGTGSGCGWRTRYVSRRAASRLVDTSAIQVWASCRSASVMMGEPAAQHAWQAGRSHAPCALHTAPRTCPQCAGGPARTCCCSLPALNNSCHHLVQRAAGDAQGTGGDWWPRQVKRAHGNAEALPWLPQYRAGRHADVLEGDAARVGAPLAQHPLLLQQHDRTTTHDGARGEATGQRDGGSAARRQRVRGVMPLLQRRTATVTAAPFLL